MLHQCALCWPQNLKSNKPSFLQTWSARSNERRRSIVSSVEYKEISDPSCCLAEGNFVQEVWGGLRPTARTRGSRRMRVHQNNDFVTMQTIFDELL